MSRQAVIGIDLGGTNCRGALVDRGGTLHFMRSEKTIVSEGLHAFWQRFVRFCRELVTDAVQNDFAVQGLGLGFPGVVTANGTVSAAPNLAPLSGFALAKRLNDELHVPVRVVNDANAIALGESSSGAGRDFQSFLMVTLGTGVGGGLVLDGKLWTGVDGSAGEVGHMVVDPAGPPCGCGSRGCLEQYASGTALVRFCGARWNAQAKTTTALQRPETAENVARAALEGHPVALQAFESAGRALGQVLAGIGNLLNLDGVVIGGGVSRNLRLLLPHIEAEIRNRAFPVVAKRMQVVSASLGDNGGILGAANALLEALER